MVEGQGKFIEVCNLCKSYDGREVLRGVSTTFSPGMINLIIGRSGAGKTVLLKCLFGLVKPDAGEILFDGQNLLTMSKRCIKQLRTTMGVLFQGAALFDSMTVMENVLFPLQMFSSMTRRQRNHRAVELLERVGLESAHGKYPSELSGGMMKRVAIARALSLQPNYLFCDEPNSGLDPTTSASIDSLLHELTSEYGITTIINTHDMNTVRSIGTHIVYIKDGQIDWEGSNTELHGDALPDSLKSFLKK